MAEDWDDPFGGSEADQERARRRREREARRAQRGGRESLGSRVGDLLGGSDSSKQRQEEPSQPRPEQRDPQPPPPAEPPAPMKPEPAAEPEFEAFDPAPAQSPEPGRDEIGGGTGEHDWLEPRAESEEFEALPEQRDREDSAEHEIIHRSTADFEAVSEEFDDIFADDTGEQPAPKPSRLERFSRPPTPRPHNPDGGSTVAGMDPIMRRRLIAVGGLLATLLLIVLAVSSLGGGDDPVEEQAAVDLAPTPMTTVTVPEGLSRTDISKLAKQADLRGNYQKKTKKAPKLFQKQIKQYGAADAPSLEGFLFPATYDLEEGAPVDDLVTQQLQAFADNISQVNLKNAADKNLTTYDVVKIASMIEREVAVPRERKLVSAVIYNRLSQGIPLGIDATLRYELDDFDSPLLESELAADTPYNTRINAGLPPTPIGNPGLASLKAAAKPANKDFLFYVIKPGTCNEHTFTADSAEFEQAVAEYQAALEAEGGSPTDCG